WTVTNYLQPSKITASARCSAAAAHASPPRLLPQSTALHFSPRTAPQKNDCRSRRPLARPFPALLQNRKRSTGPRLSRATKSQILRVPHPLPPTTKPSHPG